MLRGRPFKQGMKILTRRKMAEPDFFRKNPLVPEPWPDKRSQLALQRSADYTDASFRHENVLVTRTLKTG